MPSNDLPLLRRLNIRISHYLVALYKSGTKAQLSLSHAVNWPTTSTRHNGAAWALPRRRRRRNAYYLATPSDHRAERRPLRPAHTRARAQSIARANLRWTHFSRQRQLLGEEEAGRRECHCGEEESHTQYVSLYRKLVY